MVNVTLIIFFGKSAKNIWNLDFFNYNHWYRISKTDLFMEQYHRATAEQFITDLFVEQSNSYHSYNVEQLSQQNRYNSYNSYNVQQQSRYNSYNLERYHSKTAITD